MSKIEFYFFIMLFHRLPQEVQDIIMMYLDTKDILKFGRENVSEYVWLRKNDKKYKETCINKNVVGVQYIVEHNSKININGVFLEAVRSEYLDIIKFCIKKNARVNHHNGYALVHSARCNNLEIVKYLVDECGADVHITDRGSFAVIQYLMDKNAIDITALYSNILKLYAEIGSLDFIKYCVEKGANLYTRDNKILILSAKNGNLGIIRYYFLNSSIITNKNIIISQLDLRKE
jgi:hypothetical protein